MVRIHRGAPNYTQVGLKAIHTVVTREQSRFDPGPVCQYMRDGPVDIGTGL